MWIPDDFFDMCCSRVRNRKLWRVRQIDLVGVRARAYAVTKPAVTWMAGLQCFVGWALNQSFVPGVLGTAFNNRPERRTGLGTCSVVLARGLKASSLPNAPQGEDRGGALQT